MNLLIVTASDSVCRECRDICAESIRRYCIAYPEIRHEIHDLPEAPPHQANWSKTRLIKSLVPSCDYLLWIDPDAVVVGLRDFRQLIQPYTLNIANDGNGINGGVLAWRNCDEYFTTIERMFSMYTKFENHCWGSQAALQTLVKKIAVFYQPKSLWNAYPEEIGPTEVTKETMVVHWAGSEPNVPAPYMRKLMKESVLPV